MLGEVETLLLDETGELMQGLPSRFNTQQALENADGPPAHLLNIGDLVGLTIKPPDLDKAPVRLPQDAPPQYFLQANDVLITTRTRPPRAAVVLAKSNPPMVATQNLALLRPNEKVIYGPYLSAYLNTPDAIESLDRRYSQSSTIPLLSLSNLKQLEIPVPPLPVQRQIAALALAYEAEEQAALAALQERRALMYQAIRHATRH